MKLFTKIFLGIMVVATLAVGIAQCMNVYITFKSGIEREESSLQEQYLAIDYTLRLYWNANAQAEKRWDLTVSQVENFVSEGYEISIFNSENECVYGSADIQPEINIDIQQDSLVTKIRSIEDKYYMTSFGSLELGEETYFLNLQKDISVIFNEKENLQRYGILVYFVVMLICIAVAYLVSRLIIKPLEKLQKVAESMANGKLTVRTNIKTKDEIGQLSQSFDSMAEKIEDNIGMLEMQAKEKEDFVANFAHELKTPLTSIIGYADLIYQQKLPESKLKNASGYIINEGMRLENMSIKLMELSSVDKLDIEKELVEVSLLFENIEQAVSFIMEQRKVEFSYCCEPAYINVDVNLFKSLILNLLDNASKASAIKVQLKGVVIGDCYRISVSDNGIGIPNDELKRIEEAFYMVDKARSRKMNGAGIGLALSAKIAKAHGTALQYKSEMGKGTTVSLEISMEDLENDKV